MTTNNSKMSKKARHILDLNAKEKLQFLDSFDIVLSDCDGVLWMLVEPIPNAGTAIMLLKDAGKQYKFISNNSLRTDEEYLSKLSSLGAKDVFAYDVVHPVKTVTRYLRRHLPGEKVFSICSREINEVLIKNGIDVVTMTPRTDLTMMELINTIKPNDRVSAVIFDLNFNLTFSELARAQQYLLDDKCTLIVGCADPYVPVSKNFVTIGFEGYVKILTDCSGKQPIVLGKPGRLLGQDLIEQFCIKNTKRALFVGDSLANDIEFAVRCDFQSLFVLSGACTMEQMMELPEESKPDYVADSMADFIEFFESLQVK